MNATRNVYTWQVGAYSASLQLDGIKSGGVNHLHIQWVPSIPSRLTPEEQAQYRAGLFEALAKAQAAAGSN